MKLKSGYKFNNSLFIMPMIIFYIVVFFFEGILIFITAGLNSDGSMSGMEFASWIFIFVMGLIMFKMSFHFLSANSVSRKTMLLSSLLSGLTMAGILFVMDTINVIMLKSLTIFSEKYVTVFEMVFSKKIAGINILKYILFSLISYLLFFILGYLIEAINYRLPQKIKIAIIIGLIAFFSVGLPYLTKYINKADITFLNALSNFIKTNILGSANGFIITQLVLTAIIALISYRVAIRANLISKQG